MGLKFNKPEKLLPVFQRKIREGVAELPGYVRAGLLQHGFNFVAGDRMIDLHPGLAEKKRNRGFMAPTINTIFFAQRAYRANRKRWHSAASKAKGVVFHETGHFIDLFMAGTGNYPDGYASDREDFKTAYQKDVAQLQRTNFAAFASHNPRRKNIGYLREIFIGSTKARHEVYAELWAQMKNAEKRPVFGMPDIFPDSAKIVRRYDRELAKKAASFT